MNVVNYFNLRDDGFQQAATHFHQLKGWQQVLAVIASVVAGILTPFLLFSGSIAAFRWSVEQLFKGEDKTADLVDTVGKEIFHSDETSSEEEDSDDSESLEELRREFASGSIDLSMLDGFDDRVQLYRVKELISTFDSFWNPDQKVFNEIPFDLEKVSALLSTHNEAFKQFLIDEDKNHGVIVKKDVESGTQVYVRADLHGDLKSLLENLKELQRQKLLDAHYRCADNLQLVFLGDYMDRGSHGIEIAQILAALRLENPDQIHLIRGNHENITVNRMLGGSDDHLQAFLEDDEKSQILSTFYSTMPLTLYLGQNTGGKNEYIQFTHGLFEIRHDPAPVIDSADPFALMPVPTTLTLSNRVEQIVFDSRIDFQAMLEKAKEKPERQRLKQLHAAQRICGLAKLDQKARGDGDFFTAYNWGDVSKKTVLKSLGSRQWGLNPEDIKHYLRLCSVDHKVKMVLRGHQHGFEHHLDNKDRVLISTLPVGMDSADYMNDFDQLDRAYILESAPKVKNWTKRAITRASGESESAVSDAVGIREKSI